MPETTTREQLNEIFDQLVTVILGARNAAERGSHQLCGHRCAGGPVRPPARHTH